MSAKKEPETNQEYYGGLAAGWVVLNHEKGFVRYGEETEPRDGKAVKSRVIRTKDLAKVQLKMLALLDRDILENAAFSWKYGSGLMAKDRRRQPLGDYPEKP